MESSDLYVFCVRDLQHCSIFRAYHALLKEAIYFFQTVLLTIKWSPLYFCTYCCAPEFRKKRDGMDWWCLISHQSLRWFKRAFGRHPSSQMCDAWSGTGHVSHVTALSKLCCDHRLATCHNTVNSFDIGEKYQNGCQVPFLLQNWSRVLFRTDSTGFAEPVEFQEFYHFT